MDTVNSKKFSNVSELKDYSPCECEIDKEKIKRMLDDYCPKLTQSESELETFNDYQKKINFCFSLLSTSDLRWKPFSYDRFNMLIHNHFLTLDGLHYFSGKSFSSCGSQSEAMINSVMKGNILTPEQVVKAMVILIEQIQWDSFKEIPEEIILEVNNKRLLEEI